MCYKLAHAGSRFTLNDLNYELTRVTNRYLIETGNNKVFWSRVYRDRVFIYHMQTRRAVLELGVDTVYNGSTAPDTERVHKGFTLVILGGIHNQPLRRDLSDYANVKPLNKGRK